MRKNFSKFLMNTAMFELSCDPGTTKLFTAHPAASKLLLRKHKLRKRKRLRSFFCSGQRQPPAAPPFMVYLSKDHATMRCMMVAISARVMVDFGANTLPGLPCTRPVFAQ